MTPVVSVMLNLHSRSVPGNNCKPPMMVHSVKDVNIERTTVSFSFCTGLVTAYWSALGISKHYITKRIRKLYW